MAGLTIERWAHGGDGIGVPEDGPLRGMVVFVPGTVPGDVVRCRIVRQKRRWARAEVMELITPSPHRAKVPCAVQDACGGCPWMPGDEEVQRASRLAILAGEAKKRLGWTDEDIRDRLRLAGPAGSRLGYRGRVRMTFRVERGGAVLLGYHQQGSQRLVDVPTCVVATDAIQEALPDVRSALAGLGPGEGSVLLVSGDDGVAGSIRMAGKPATQFGPDRVLVRQGEHRVHATAESFVQANADVAGSLVDAVEAAARLAGGSEATELFSGSGTLTLGLLRAGYRVAAYESDPRARSLFEATVKGAGEAAWHRADLLAAGIVEPAPPSPDLVLLDPPRQGAAEMLPWIRGAGAPTVILVSCDVATCFRDVASLTVGDSAPYQVTSVTGFDMFPHTGHQEMLVVMTR